MGISIITNHGRKYYRSSVMIRGNQSIRQFPFTLEGRALAQAWEKEKRETLAKIPPINQGKVKMDRSALDERFTPYYKSGERVHVEYLDGRTERFYVGRTGGPNPVYVKLKTNKAMSGEQIDNTELIICLYGLGKFHSTKVKK